MWVAGTKHLDHLGLLDMGQYQGTGLETEQLGLLVLQAVGLTCYTIIPGPSI